MVIVTQSFTPPTEGVLHHQPNTKLLINDQEFGTGSLYITQQSVQWGDGVRSSGVPLPALSLQYRTISLHAIQKEPSLSLYMVLDFELTLPEISNNGNEEDFVDEPYTRLRFIPPTEEDLTAMYDAMNQGQALHPDTDAEEMADNELFVNGQDFDDEGAYDCDEFEDAEENSPEDPSGDMERLNIQPNGNHGGANQNPW